MKKFILFLVAPISKFISLFSIPERKMDDLELEQLKAFIIDGDCLVSRSDYELSNIFMPGEWKHVALYYKGHVYESVTGGVRKTPIEEFFYKKDQIGLCRLHKEIDFSLAIPFLDSTIGMPYDWSFSGKNDKYYCSELAYKAYSLVDETFTKTFISSYYFGEMVIRPTDMWKNLIQIKRW